MNTRSLLLSVLCVGLLSACGSTGPTSSIDEEEESTWNGPIPTTTSTTSGGGGAGASSGAGGDDGVGGSSSSASTSSSSSSTSSSASSSSSSSSSTGGGTTCASEPDWESCSSCCDAQFPGQYDQLIGYMAGACACVSGAACYTACDSGKPCSDASYSNASCDSCWQDEINSGTSSCVPNGVSNCQGDADCKPILTCLNTCPAE